MKLKPLVSLLAAAFAAPLALASTSGVVISQVYGGGGNANAPLANDFVELFNAGGSNVDISGWSIQYTSAAGNSWGSNALTVPSGVTLQAGHYYLIKLASGGAAGSALPTPDQTGNINMSGTAGKIALASSATALTGAAPADAQLVDIVSYGSTATQTEGAQAPAPSNTLGLFRAAGGCTDTNVNSADFSTGTPAPRNSSASANLCNGTPANQPILPSCPPASAVSGTPSNFSVSATDPDSVVNSATMTGTWPAGVTLGTFSAASGDGGTATQPVSVAGSVPVGSYNLGLQWANDDAQTASCTIKLSVSGLATIMAIQGNGAKSPMAGNAVTTSGVVTLVINNGFYLQDPLGDNDPSTSDGIFVFTSTAPTVAVGDAVSVSGTVQEYSVATSAASQAAPLTEISSVTNVAVSSHGNQVPAPVMVDILAEGGKLERFEGMVVTLKGPLMVQQNAFLGQYGQLTLAAGDRLQQPTNVYVPGAQANALYAENLARSVVLDDGSSLTDPNPPPYLAADHTVRDGDSLADLTGVIDFGLANTSSSGDVSYKIQPTVAPVITRVNQRPAAPDPVGGNVRVGSANMLNYFSTFTNGSDVFGHTGQGCTVGTGTSAGNCRGATTLDEFKRQTAKAVNALSGLNADVIALMEMQNNQDITVNYLVSQLNAKLGDGTYATVPFPSQGVGTDAIRVAMIYKPGRVTLNGVSLSNSNAINNRFPLAQGFMAQNGQKFAVIANHLKSKGSCPSGSGADSDTGDQQSCWNATRVQQANVLKAWLPTVQAAAGTGDILMLGDFNAYAKEDPITALTGDGAIVDLIDRYAPGDYSYVFDAFAGRLDQGLGTASIAGKVTGATSWHINADEPEFLDYTTVGKPVDYYSPAAIRTSDHDPLVLGLNLVANLGGTSGRDTIVGTPGDDVIEGGPGADTLTGNGGHDQFVYSSILDAGDTITDFKPGVDLLVFTKLLASMGIASADPLGQGYVTCSTSAGSAVINVDTDGSTGAAKPRAVVQLKGVSCSAINATSFKF